MKIRLYSTDTDAGTVSVLDPNAEESLVSTIIVGNAPRGAVKFTKKGRGYVCNCGGDTISEIDLFTNREIAKIKVGLAPRGMGITEGDRFALISNSGSNTISIIDLEQRSEVYQLHVGRDPRHMGISKDGKYAFICIWGSQHVSKIDIGELKSPNPDFSKVKEIAQVFVGSEAYPYSLCVDSNQNRLYVANTQAKYLSVIDYESNSIITQIELGTKGGRGVVLNEDQSIAFLTIENTSEVVFIDTQTFEIIKRIPTGPGPRGLAYEGITKTLWVAEFERPSGGGIIDIEGTVTELKLQNQLRNFVKSTKLELDSLIEYRGLNGGKGCCSISYFDIDEIMK